MKAYSLLMLGLAYASCANYQSGFVSVSGGGQLYYEARGKGESMLLLHGHSLDRRMWDAQWKPLSKHYRVVRLDFRGYGRSSEQREDLQMTHVDDVLVLMDSLHIQKAHVEGLSMGAFVAGDMLAMYPDRMLTCVMASGGIRNSKGHFHNIRQVIDRLLQNLIRFPAGTDTTAVGADDSRLDGMATTP